MRVFPSPKRLVVSLLLGVLSLVALLVLLEKRLIYFPYRTLDPTPSSLGLAFEDVRLTAEDGVRIHGWFLPVDNPRYTVLVCHGNAGNISHRLDRAMSLQGQIGASVLLFDYRGYGQSEGSPDEEGTYRDARAAYAFLTERKGAKPESLVLFGESLGTAVALQLALEKPARALVLESPFASMRDMAREALPFLPVWHLVRTRYESEAKAPRLRMPLLVLHGEKDDMVPIAQARRVFAAAPDPKRFYAIPEGGHNDTYIMGGSAYWNVWREFLKST
jgi:uncharacterized protein